MDFYPELLQYAVHCHRFPPPCHSFNVALLLFRSNIRIMLLCNGILICFTAAVRRELWYDWLRLFLEQYQTTEAPEEMTEAPEGATTLAPATTPTGGEGDGEQPNPSDCPICKNAPVRLVFRSL